MIQWLLGLFKKKQKELVCIRQDQAYRWPSNLGERTPGKCAKCDRPIFYEKQNEDFRKICNTCAGLW